ncbi:MAG: transcriptional regulator [Sedimentibacter sp.]|jgi:transcriptional regulator with PAS, ATPase and Fis domain|nr:transcriptional regulator [Sedimentibacter sp.]
MKKIKIVYYSRNDWIIIDHIKKNLEDVFENSVQFQNVFLEELGENEKIDGDLFLVLYDDYIYSVSKHINNLNNIVTITRGINRKHITELKTIKTPTDILIVNDDDLSTLQTTYTLQGLGLNHITFIPYNKALDKNNYYSNIKIAITPNAVSSMPDYIEKVINIGYREVGYDTLTKIMQKLRIDSDLVYVNILKRMNDIVEPNSDTRTNDLINSYLKGEMLNKVISNNNEGVLLTDNNYNLVYSNERANMIFNIKDSNLTNNLSDFMDKSIYHNICDSDFKNKYMKINEEMYTIKKTSVKIMDMIIGYSFFFGHEKSIRDLEINLKSLFIEKGQFAKYSFKDILYSSKAMDNCISLAKKASLTNHTILIQGETGTGKELIAQSIHNYSYRKKAPFVAINCAALPETLLVSELFGYEGGSFTGAKKDGKLGLFEQANTGTIFLDEIGDISQNLQRQLLRVIQERQIMRIGSDRLIDIDVRIIVATNKILLDEVHKNNFRSDLYYRLNVIPINIPPLKERKKDILLILENKLGQKFSHLTNREKNLILSYDWPGNIRELESAANYYKTLGAFPDYINMTKHKILNDSSKLDQQVLKIINENTDLYSGIGRANIIKELKIIGINIGDTKLRDILLNLKNENLIEINQGRAGNRILQNGIEYLNNRA